MKTLYSFTINISKSFGLLGSNATRIPTPPVRRGLGLSAGSVTVPTPGRRQTRKGGGGEARAQPYDSDGPGPAIRVAAPRRAAALGSPAEDSEVAGELAVSAPLLRDSS